MYKLCNHVFFFKQKTAYEMRISDWSSDVCSSDLIHHASYPQIARNPGNPHAPHDERQLGPDRGHQRRRPVRFRPRPARGPHDRRGYEQRDQPAPEFGVKKGPASLSHARPGCWARRSPISSASRCSSCCTEVGEPVRLFQIVPNYLNYPYFSKDIGAVEKTRTSTAFRPQRPQRCASTSSATTAHHEGPNRSDTG